MGSSYIRAGPVRLSVTGTTSPSGEPEYYKYMYCAEQFFFLPLRRRIVVLFLF